MECMYDGDTVSLTWEQPSGELDQAKGTVVPFDDRVAARQIITDGRKLLLEATVDPLEVVVAEIRSESIEYCGMLFRFLFSSSQTDPLQIIPKGAEVPKPLIGYTGDLKITDIDPHSEYNESYLVKIEENGLKLFDDRLLRTIDACLIDGEDETTVSIEPSDYRFDRTYVYVDKRPGSYFAAQKTEYGSAVIGALSGYCTTLLSQLYQELNLTRSDRTYAVMEIQWIRTTLDKIRPLVTRVSAPETRGESDKIAQRDTHPTHPTGIVIDTVRNLSTRLRDAVEDTDSLASWHRRDVLDGLTEVDRRLELLETWLSVSIDEYLREQYLDSLEDGLD